MNLNLNPNLETELVPSWVRFRDREPETEPEPEPELDGFRVWVQDPLGFLMGGLVLDACPLSPHMFLLSFVTGAKS